MRVSYPQALLGGLAVVLVIALVVAASTSTAAFGVYNPAWNGAGELRDVAADKNTTATIAVNTSSYTTSQPNETVAVVLSPTEPYGAETATLRRFVANGGTLVIAEDFGPAGNELLDVVGATARFDGRLVRDERTHATGPALPEATNTTATSLTRDVEQVTLNYATVVEPNGAKVVIGTSSFAYLDTNRNDELDDDEPLRSYPVVTVESVGDGRVIAVSDPSLFINAMLERPDNRQFAANLFDHERVILDYSHAGGQPPLSLALLQIRGTPLLQGGLLALLAGGVLVGSRLWGRTEAADREWRPDPDRVARYLARERDWDPERARRLTTGVWGRAAEREDDE